MLAAQEVYQAEAYDDMNLLIHDSRRLSNSIYHAAEEAHTHLNHRDYDGVRKKIDNIIASQTMLKIRTDLLDFSGNPEAVAESDFVPVYRKVHKVMRSFMPTSAKRNITLTLTGPSFQVTFGPTAFEIVPYILIDNAIKYSPRGEEVKIRVIDYQNRTVFEVESIGPHIEHDEMLKIFESGYRGRNAVKTSAPGSGIGLFLVKNLVEKFKGKIYVRQDEIDYEGWLVSAVRTCFVVSVPSWPAARERTVTA